MSQQVTAPPSVAAPAEIKLFQKWSFKEITVKDIGLQRYLNLTPMVAPHSCGRHEHQRFRKSKVNIVERLINGLMRGGKNAGKKAKATIIVKEAFEILWLWECKKKEYLKYGFQVTKRRIRRKAISQET